MEKFDSAALRRAYLDFFAARGHAVIPSASVIPENDPTVLFTTAGMHPLVPYLLGEKHPSGTRLTDVQVCVRTGDIDEVGDLSHCTFFEMLGNWSLGDYFKNDSIAWSWEFLTEVLKIDKNKIAVTVFAGDDDCPRDEESAKLWLSLGVAPEHVFYLPKKNNWWGPAGQTGPCGPDTEIFIIRDVPDCSETCSPACDCGKYLEIWNNVFMQYQKTADGKLVPLEKPNVDTGMGLERTVCILNGFSSVYETDLFDFAIKKLEELSQRKYGANPDDTRAMRIVADHVRTATFILGDRNGVVPSNVDQGYVLRRLIRRAVRFGRLLSLPEGALSELCSLFVDKYQSVYPVIGENRAKILDELQKEEKKFSATLQQGLKKFENMVAHMPVKSISGETAFRLYDTFGFPLEMTVELAQENGFTVDVEGYENAFKAHQEKSKLGSEQKFKGGLADDSVATARLHSATHLMHRALQIVLGEAVKQKGSNITAERLRFDFEFERAMTADEIAEVERLVNEQIQQNSEILCREMSVTDAKEEGAIGVFDSKYGDKVKVYTIGFSKEICGGPHASATGELGSFKIEKEQSSSAGVRRIRAVLN